MKHIIAREIEERKGTWILGYNSGRQNGFVAGVLTAVAVACIAVLIAIIISCL